MAASLSLEPLGRVVRSCRGRPHEARPCSNAIFAGHSKNQGFVRRRGVSYSVARPTLSGARAEGADAVGFEADSVARQVQRETGPIAKYLDLIIASRAR